MTNHNDVPDRATPAHLQPTDQSDRGWVLTVPICESRASGHETYRDREFTLMVVACDDDAEVILACFADRTA